MKMKHLWPGVSAIALFAGATVSASADEFTKSYDENVDIDFTNTVDVSLTKKISVNKTLNFSGTVDIDGDIDGINEAAFAVIDNKQVLNGNTVTYNADPDGQPDPSNFAHLSAGALNGANGNIGMNVAAGDVNLQDNAATIAYTGSQDGNDGTRASVDAESFVLQESYGNTFAIESGYSHNTAKLEGEFLTGANGNIGLNVAAGALNAQKNGLAIAASEGDAVLAEASAATLQQVDTANVTYAGVFASNQALLLAGMANGANGNVGINVAAGSNNLQSNSLTISTTGIGRN